MENIDTLLKNKITDPARINVKLKTFMFLWALCC